MAKGKVIFNEERCKSCGLCNITYKNVSKRRVDVVLSSI